MWSLINVSNNLHNTDVKLTGLYISVHSTGTLPSLIGILKKMCKWCPYFVYISLSKLGVIPSTPGDLF